jgi:hypothetical protein
MSCKAGVQCSDTLMDVKQHRVGHVLLNRLRQQCAPHTDTFELVQLTWITKCRNWEIITAIPKSPSSDHSSSTSNPAALATRFVMSSSTPLPGPGSSSPTREAQIG